MTKRFPRQKCYEDLENNAPSSVVTVQSVRKWHETKVNTSREIPCVRAPSVKNSYFCGLNSSIFFSRSIQSRYNFQILDGNCGRERKKKKN